MKALLRKIRQILRDRKTRRIFTRLVSTVAAIVVFVTTYALVLPAITMESEAACGIEAHQHDQSCYTDVLVCELPESPGHVHNESCYSTKQKQVCQIKEHVHDSDCYDGNGELICEKDEHQHGEDCFEEVRELVCEIPESPGHQHDDSCYQKVLTCGREVHTHSTACYRADTASQAATEAIAVASTESAAAAATGNGLVDNLNDPVENGEPETSLDSSIENNVIDGNLDASPNYSEPGSDSPSLTNEGDKDEPGAWTSTEAAADATAATAASTGSGAGVTGSTAAATGSTTGGTVATVASAGATDTMSAAAGYVPVLDELNFDTLLNKHTRIYYSRLAGTDSSVDNETNGADAAKNTGEPQEEVTWNRIDKHTELKESDNLRLYLAYTIPAGSLNETNQTARYSLPQNIRLTDEQVDEINATVNGIAGQYVSYDTLEILDQEMYGKYLGIEAVEGTRTPADNLDEYLANNEGQEFISATVKVENVFDESTGFLKAQDLVFAFAPYTIQKNQHQYDFEGQPIKAGEEVSGWLAIDVSTEQIYWEKADDETKTADIIFVEKDKKSDLKEISTELKLVETAVNGSEDYSTDESDTNGDDEIATDLATKIASDEDKGTSADKTEDKKLATDNEAGEGRKNKANPLLIMPAMSFSDSITVLTGRPIAGENGGTMEDAAVANAAISLPEEAEISVRVEADEGTFPAGTIMVLKAVEDLDTVAEAVTETVEKTAAVSADDDSDSDSDTNGGSETKAAERTEAEKPEKQEKQNTTTNRKPYGFQAVDITFKDSDGNEIEPAKPVRVALTSEIVEQVRQEIQDIEKSENSEEPGTGVGTSNGMIADPVIVHVDDNGNAEQMELVVPEDIKPAQGRTEEELLEERKAASDKEDSDKAADTDAAAGDDSDESAKSGSTVEFETDSFSVYAIVYTVDFHYEINGKMYDFNIPGGGFVSLEHLVEVLGIASNDENTKNGAENAETDAEDRKDFAGEVLGEDRSGENEEGSANAIADGEISSPKDSTTYEEAIKLNEGEVSEATKKFVADVERVEFSKPELVWVGKVDEATTVGGIKESRGLEVEYSAELTEEQIAEINAQEVKAGDWALIGLRPFDTEETLNVTMKNGDQWAIKVTDEVIDTGSEVDSYIQDGYRFYIFSTVRSPGYYQYWGDYYLCYNGGAGVDSSYSRDAEDLDTMLGDDYLWEITKVSSEKYTVRNVGHPDCYVSLTDDTVITQSSTTILFNPRYNNDGFQLVNESSDLCLTLTFQGQHFYFGTEDRDYTWGARIKLVPTQPSFKITVNVQSSGTGTVQEAANTPGTSIEATINNEGKNQNVIKAIPAAGYSFDYWLKNNVRQNGYPYSSAEIAQRSADLREGDVLTAVFVKKTYDITLTQDNIAHGYVSYNDASSGSNVVKGTSEDTQSIVQYTVASDNTERAASAPITAKGKLPVRSK